MIDDGDEKPKPNKMSRRYILLRLSVSDRELPYEDDPRTCFSS